MGKEAVGRCAPESIDIMITACMCLHFWHFPAIIGFTSKINIVREAPGGELILPGVFFGRRFLSIVILLKHLLYIISRIFL